MAGYWASRPQNSFYKTAFLLVAYFLLFDVVVEPTYFGPYGSQSGSHFSDENYEDHGPITEVIIRSARLIDSIQVRYGSFLGPVRGGRGGDRHSFRLDPGEYITRIEGKSQNVVDRLKFITNRGRTYGPYGGGGGRPFTAHVGHLKYISGFSANLLDLINFHD